MLLEVLKGSDLRTKNLTLTRKKSIIYYTKNKFHLYRPFHRLSIKNVTIYYHKIIFSQRGVI